MKKIGLWVVSFVVILGTGRTASAGTLDVLEAGMLLTNTIPDVDLDSLSRIYGFTPGAVLNYSGTVTTTGFTENLVGTYLGNLLNITYTGNSTGYPNTIAWTTSGSYGGASWTSGINSATFSFPTSTTFNIQYLSSFGLGSNTASDNLTITADFTNPVPTYTGTTGTITINGDGDPAPSTYNSIGPLNFLDPWPPREGQRVATDIDYRVGNPLWLDVTTFHNVRPNAFDFTGTLASVPEPDSLVLLLFGIVGLIGHGRCLGKTGHRGL